MVQAVYLPNCILDYGLSGSELSVFSVLTVSGKPSGYITMKRIAEATALSVSTVIRSVKKLEARGLISVRRCFYLHRRATNKYTVKLRAAQCAFFALPLAAVKALKGKALIVYAYFCAHSSKEGLSFASERAMSREMNVSRNTVRKLTKLLEKLLVLAKKARLYLNTTAKRSFLYVFNKGWFNFDTMSMNPQENNHREKKIRKTKLLRRIFSAAVSLPRRMKSFFAEKIREKRQNKGFFGKLKGIFARRRL